VRILVAIATAAVLLSGVAAPHHHAAPGGAHECVACTVGGALEARVATPELPPPAPVRVASAPEPVSVPTVGFPMGAVPGQSPPA
jgi:hypothetical protein